MIDLGTGGVGGFKSQAYAINDAGRVIGCVASTTTGNYERACVWAPKLGVFKKEDRVMAVPGGANVRDEALSAPPLYKQEQGVHGTVVDGPKFGTAQNCAGEGCTGNWYKIRWDAGYPLRDSTGRLTVIQEGWSAESYLKSVGTLGDFNPAPDFSTKPYSEENIYWQNGNAPASINPPNPDGSQVVDSDSLGNCVWYAWGRMFELGYNPHQLAVFYRPATTWADIALQSGIPVDSTPTVGSIAQKPSPPGSPETPGHVAVVESSNVDGTITVTESSYATGDYVYQSFLWRNRTFADYSSYNFIHLSKGTANLPPIATPITLTAWRDTRQELPVARVLALCNDLDHDRVDLTGVSTLSSKGGEVRLASGLITYTPPSGFVGTDSFTYTLQDAPGASAQGTVSIIVSAPSATAPNTLGITVTPIGGKTIINLSFAGIPTLVYELLSSTDLVTWTAIGQVTAGPRGLIVFTDEIAGSDSHRYYRTRRK